MKAIKSPEIIFKANYTPIVQHQEVLTEVNKAYKVHRKIEKGYENQEAITSEIMKQENVFKRNFIPAVKPKDLQEVKDRRRHNFSQDVNIAGGIFMTSLLKGSKHT
jgi:hypothetical protein